MGSSFYQVTNFAVHMLYEYLITQDIGQGPKPSTVPGAKKGNRDRDQIIGTNHWDQKWLGPNYAILKLLIYYISWHGRCGDRRTAQGAKQTTAWSGLVRGTELGWDGFLYSATVEGIYTFGSGWFMEFLQQIKSYSHRIMQREFKQLQLF